MPRRSILSITEKQSLIALPDNQAEFIRHYSFSESDLSIIRQRRGDANRLGFAIQLCYMRYPGIILGVNETPDTYLLDFVSKQLGLPTNAWDSYSLREQTRREHLVELQQSFGFKVFSHFNYPQYVTYLTVLAIDTDKGIVLAEHLINHLRTQNVLLPAISTLEQICAEASIQANKIIYDRLTTGLTDIHLDKLDKLLTIKD